MPLPSPARRQSGRRAKNRRNAAPAAAVLHNMPTFAQKSNTRRAGRHSNEAAVADGRRQRR
jgi:hypothetical protein